MLGQDQWISIKLNSLINKGVVKKKKRFQNELISVTFLSTGET